MAVTEASHSAARALDDLYRRHGGDVYRYALAVLGNHADAEDVTQTTFLNAYRALEQGVHPRKPANWLLTIASNAIKERFRREQSRPREVELDRDVASNGTDEDTPSVGELLTALARIPPQQRQALVLREFEGRSYNEIAEILGVTTSALETLLFRARRSLTEELAHQLTCTGAQQSISRAADGRLPRKEKRRLNEHLAECPDCAQFARLQQRHRKALRTLSLVPIPLSLTLFKGFEGSAAAATLPAAAAAGAGSAVAGSGAGVGAGIGGAAAAGGGGVFAGGLALKAAAVVAAAGVAGGATVAGVKELEKPGKTAKPAVTTRGKSHQLHSQRASHASPQGIARGRALARGQTGAAPPGQARRSAPKRAGTAKTKAQSPKARAQAQPKPRQTRLKPARPPRAKPLRPEKTRSRTPRAAKNVAPGAAASAPPAAAEPTTTATGPQAKVRGGSPAAGSRKPSK